METKSEKTAKKFSFRKRRSSKGKKEDDEQQPVDLEAEQPTTEEKCEGTPEKASGIVEEKDFETPTNTVEDVKAPESLGENSAQKSSVEGSENAGKKKSKRRSLFKRKKSSVEENCELQVKESEDKSENKGQEDEGEASFVESTVDGMSSEAGQVVCEAKQTDTTEQSDGEGYLSVGEVSEAEGESLLEEGKESSPESVKIEADKGTKRKGFFKRGLSLKRRKSKKQTREPKEDAIAAATTTEQTCVEETPTEATLQNSETPDNKDLHEDENLTDNHEDTGSKTDSDNTSSALAKKLPVKPKRKVSFIGPDGTKLDSADEGDSPTERPVETSDESDEDTITGENVPSAVSEEVSQDVVPEVVVMTENAGCSESLPEGDEDDLTEVSSMSSDLLASSDAPDTISTSDTSRMFTLTDTDDNGSRITLEEINEESEAEPKPEIVENVPEDNQESNLGEGSGTKQDVADEETGTESKEEAKPEESELKPDILGSGSESGLEAPEKDVNEDTRLLGDGDVSKVGEWEMLNKSYDMSVELSRVRKQTLFSVKRLCCSVM